MPCFRQMVDVIHWCLELGVKFISVYAFSIDNFRRTPEEVSTLMDLAEAKFHELMQVRPGDVLLRFAAFTLRCCSL